MPTQAFSRISEALSRACSFSTHAARGTVRLAVIEGGFRPRSVTPEQMQVVLREIMPEMLSHRGVRRAVLVCKNLSKELSNLDPVNLSAGNDGPPQALRVP